ncbi:MAG: YraN family protein [Prevotella sp.]|nr:YraN family protein [Prevotella sp.]
MAEHNDLGSWGEDYATEYLTKNGYIILERDWRYGRSKVDVDIICKTPDRRTVVFAEVKTRATEELTDPEDAVDIRKIRHIGRAAHEYVQMHDVVEELRFDIIALVGRKGSSNIQINHIEDAFNPLLI